MNTLLIVDDNLDVRGAIRDFIHHWQPSVRIIEADDGNEGCRLAEQYHPDVILMDMRMIKMNGDIATATLKMGEGTGNIPIIGMTADAGFNVYIKREAEPVCQAFLHKPFNVTELFDTINTVLPLNHH